MTFTLQLIHVTQRQAESRVKPFEPGLCRFKEGKKQFLFLPACDAGKQNGINQRWCSSPQLRCYSINIYFNPEAQFNNTFFVGIKLHRNKPLQKHISPLVEPEQLAPTQMSATHLHPRSSESQHIPEPLLQQLLNTKMMLSQHQYYAICSLHAAHTVNSSTSQFLSSRFMLLNTSQECRSLHRLSQQQQ